MRSIAHNGPISDLHFLELGSTDEVGASSHLYLLWHGLHHHAVLCLVALLFTQWLRLSRLDGLFGETVPAIRREIAGDIPRRSRTQLRYCPCCTALFIRP
ncbi:hypothetical protein [Deinococcus marmoris]|uniref:hypothetical protein n=1 Tax=Deinococcus marmoris TaxID=249408 RepID=UPI00111517A3|nr:hypothetical protein [Deinococcus marmoris]